MLLRLRSKRNSSAAAAKPRCSLSPRDFRRLAHSGAPFLYFYVSIQYASLQAVIFDSCAADVGDLPSGSVRTDRFEGLQD